MGIEIDRTGMFAADVRQPRLLRGIGHRQRELIHQGLKQVGATRSDEPSHKPLVLEPFEGALD